MLLGYVYKIYPIMMTFSELFIVELVSNFCIDENSHVKDQFNPS